METSQASFIILDIIRERASNGVITQACGDLTNNYYTQIAAANTTYTINWGTNGGSSGQVKIVVGNASLLIEYDDINEVIVMFGTCGTTDWDDFSVVGGTSLQYSNNGFSFDIEVELHNANTLKINIVSTINTTINAFD